MSGVLGRDPEQDPREGVCACERGPVAERDCPRGGTCSTCCDGCAADCGLRASDEAERAEAIAAELGAEPEPARSFASWLLFSLREPYATSIIRGLKTVEFRRRVPTAVRELGEGERARILVYASRRGRVLGEVSCTGLIAATPADLWRLVLEQGRTPGIDRVRFHEYFTRAPLGYGLLLADPIEYAQPLDAKLHGLRPPQAFAYAGSLPGSLLAAADAAAEEARARG